MPTEHIVRSYDEDLRKLRDMIARMGGLVERQVADATRALVRRDSDLAGEVVQRDVQIDQLEREIEAFCVRLLALRQPMAADLRLIIAGMKVSNDLERIGDYAANANIAERIHFAVRGENLPEDRPKGDTSAFAVVRAPGD
jgi:phosphate transport system protein